MWHFGMAYADFYAAVWELHMEFRHAVHELLLDSNVFLDNIKIRLTMPLFWRYTYRWIFRIKYTDYTFGKPDFCKLDLWRIVWTALANSDKWGTPASYGSFALFSSCAMLRCSLSYTRLAIRKWIEFDFLFQPEFLSIVLVDPGFKTTQERTTGRDKSRSHNRWHESPLNGRRKLPINLKWPKAFGS